MNKIKNNKFLFILLIFISLILVLAFIIEYKLGHKPCKLCIYQRIPYFISIFLLLKFFFTTGYEKITLLILSTIFIISSILALYHFGIEQGFFKESFVCLSNENFSEILSKEQLLEKLTQNTISCKDISFKFLGFSLATINTIFSICLSVIFFKLFTNYGKN
tara:strand:- start:393 stop:878 length:486 start_codon:yes stop_codon:yes gene_type:complete